MLEILAVWLFSLTIIIALGRIVHFFLFKKDAGMQNFLLFNGLFAYMLLIWLILYFYGFSLIFQIFFFVFSIIFLIYRPEFVRTIWHVFKKFSLSDKILLFIILIVVLMLSAAFSSLPDNESYYIQTVKWANEQGFIKGLMNIHPFLGQFSGWHILQAGCNLHYKSLTFNDLNGLFLLIFVFYWLQTVRKYGLKQTYWFVIFPVVSVLTVFFIDSPSPDLSVALLSLIVFDLFIINFKHFNINLFIEMFLLASLSFLIKPTAVINVIPVLILWWRYRRILNVYSMKMLILGLILLSLWFSKNYIVTGYIFYPFDLLGDLVKPVWQYPRELMQYISQLGQRENMALSLSGHLITGFWQWLRQPGIHQIINPLIVILLVLYPVILVLKKQKLKISNPYWLLYLTGSIYFMIILFISPNFRFYLSFLLFLAMSIKAFSGSQLNFKYFNTFGWILFIFAGIFLSLRQHFGLKNIITPRPVSSLNVPFKTESVGNLEYHYPDDSRLFWQTGDAPLPAVHKRQIAFFWQNFNIVPQQSPDKKYYYSKPVRNPKKKHF